MESPDTEEYSCGYCLSKREDMLDSKKLPCGHIFCNDCLRNDCQNSSKMKCIYCSAEFDDLDLEKLESAEKKCPPCDVCGQNSNSEIFCMTCEKSLCKEHAEIHNSFTKQFGLIHQTKQATIQCDASPTSGKYPCTEHDEEVRGACAHCHRLLCFRCLIHNQCTKSSSKCHDVSELQELSESFKVNLSKIVQDLLNRMIEIAEFEKKAYCKLSEEETKCGLMKDMVKTVLREQIKQLESNAEKMMQDIDIYYGVCKNKVLDYENLLKSIGDQTELIRKDAHELKQKTDYEIILKTNEIQGRSEKALSNRKFTYNLPIESYGLSDYKISRFAPSRLHQQFCINLMVSY